jgi:hypothetical protein
LVSALCHWLVLRNRTYPATDDTILSDAHICEVGWSSPVIICDRVITHDPPQWYGYAMDLFRPIVAAIKEYVTVLFFCDYQVGTVFFQYLM